MNSKENSVNIVEDKMAAGPNSEVAHDDTVWQTVKANPKVIAVSVLVTVGPLIYGFDNVIIGLVVAMPSFQADFGELYNGTIILPSIWLALWGALLQAGSMFGSAINGPIADRFGRKVPFTIGAVITCISTGIVYVSNIPDSLQGRRGTFLAGKIIVGIGLGMLLSTCQTYISEIAPAKIRGPLLSIFTFFLVVGQLIAVSIVFARITIAGPEAYKVCFASQWAIAGVAIIIGLFIPESPAYLVRKNKLEAAEKAYARLHSKELAAQGIEELKRTVEEEKIMSGHEEANYSDCFKGANWRRTRIVIYANIVQQFLGVSLLANSTLLLELGGMSPTNALQVTEVSIGLGLFANLISWFLMTSFGRRNVILFGIGFISLMWLGIGIAGCFNSSGALWFIGVTFIVIGFFYGISIGGIYPVIAAETSSIKLRAKTLSVGFLANAFSSWLFSFIVPYMFNADAGNLGGKTGFVFLVLCILALILFFFELPEMKGRTYGELDAMFEDRLPTRKFAKHVIGDSSRTAMA